MKCAILCFTALPFLLGGQMPETLFRSQLQEARISDRQAMEIDIGGILRRFARGVDKSEELSRMLEKEDFSIYSFEGKNEIQPTCEDADRLVVASGRLGPHGPVSYDEALITICSKNGTIKKLEGKIFSKNL